MISNDFAVSAAQVCKLDSRGADQVFSLPPFLEFGTSLHTLFISSLPMKYGFLHFAASPAAGPRIRRCESCPADIAVLALSFEVTSMPSHQPASRHDVPSTQKAHDEGTCRPCAYFWAKADGCRLGADCAFCHLCPPEEFKRRRKEKNKQMRDATAGMTASKQQ
eukprot:TRINITY_DN26442_c0_g3_i1.p1 TRINITY_DN26442_c0_g3~~TRINITY_DN26442_c0_g3_i1.p1  ORF type:complete len:164 (-),score=14.53 TRINITY_DN26442_c0_g3_i1:440-931(-)